MTTLCGLTPSSRATLVRAVRGLAFSGVLALLFISLTAPLGRGQVQGQSQGSSAGAARLNKFLVPTFISLQALDAGVTEYGFRNMKWQEHNPLVPHSTAGRMAYFGLTGAAVVGGTNWLERKGHRELARIALIGGIAVEGYAATHSLIGVQR